MFIGCPILALAPVSAPQLVQKTFTYDADSDLQSVTVAGTFNYWNKDANPLKANGRRWSGTFSLPPGEIQYKFVLNGSKWILDPANPRKSVDAAGNPNSIAMLLPIDYSAPAAKGDGLITRSAVYHDQSPAFLDRDGDRLVFRLRTRSGDVARPRLLIGKQVIEMKPLATGELYEVDEASVPWRNQNVNYSFLLDDGAAHLYLSPEGLTNERPKETFTASASTIRDVEVPDWPQHSVVYQIFPDRFANGDKSNDPAGTVPWDAKPTYYNIFGGDIAGVRQHLTYLRDLGINAIYFNPIFDSPVNHRYETTDYYKVDPGFGTNAQFISLTHELKSDGIRTILDGVYNHVATSFFAFADILKNQQASPYNDWFFIKSYPVKVTTPAPYECWYGFAELPKVHITNPATSKYFLDEPRYWDDHADIAGWRLDAANEVDDSHWPKFRRVVKDDKNRWIVGEIWSDASHWLQGNMFDSVMGYQFRAATLDFCATKTTGPTRYFNDLMGVYASYAPQISRNLMNLLSSHDTPRFLTLCRGDRKMAMLGATMQLTWPGTPSVYYGEELGMEGGADPDNRRGMRWDLDTSSNPLLAHYRKLIAARRSSLALQVGTPIPLLLDDSAETLAFGRSADQDEAIVALNRSSETRDLAIRIPAGWGTGFRDVLSGSEYKSSGGELHISMPAESSAVLLKTRAQHR